MSGDSTVTQNPILNGETRVFVRRCLAAGLVEIDELKKVVVSLMTESEAFTPQRLAEGLVGAEILTRWQASKLLAGKSRGFYLGSYRLLRPLGKGGMGVVYLGEHHVMKKLMALKILPPEATKDSRRIARFKEEARACAQLEHKNIVNAYDFAEAGGKLYIVMEFVDGIDLQHVIHRDGVMSVADAIDALTQAAEGLAHAHERGIIHRDIKPSNLLLRTDGVVKVSDLGLARIGWAGDEGREKSRLTGTADFVAPEQAINSNAVDARADIYSLGCTVFYLLTGRSPFDGDTVAKRLAKHQTAAVPDVRAFRKDCPAAFAELIMRMMAKRPDDRPKSAVELLAQLRRLAGVPSGSVGKSLRGVKPASDTVVDAEVYQATIDDTSLSADGEVEVVEVAEEFDFGTLPPVENLPAVPNTTGLNPVLQPPAKAPGQVPAKPARPAKKPVSNAEGGNQQLLLGIGLAVAIIALLAVVGMGIASVLKPPPSQTPRIKTVEMGKDGGPKVLVIQE